MKYHTSLSDRIAAKKYDMVMNILNNKGIDVTYNEGEFFILAIKNNSTNIVKSLLDYFKKSQLTSYDTSRVENMSREDQLLTSKVRNVLDIAIQDVDLSQEMKEILSPYIDFEGSEHDTLNDSFSDEYITSSPTNLNKTNSNTSNPNILNEGILRRFNAETDKISQKQIIEDVLGFNSHDITENHEDSNVELQLALVGKLTKILESDL